jgi:Leucine-rich repeat (LRR) protein
MRVLVALLLVGNAGCGGGEETAPSDVAALNKLGVGIKQDDHEVIIISDKITDADLVHLKGLANLQSLTLFRLKITDAGLVHLKGMTKLETLSLELTKITESGLVHLKGLTELQTLKLDGTKVTDASEGRYRG